MSIFILIVFIVVLVSISNLLQRFITGNGHRVQAMLMGYVAVLLLSMFIFFLLPVDNKEQEKHAKDKEEVPSLYELTETGQIDQIDKQYIREQWEFPFEGDSINISNIDGEIVTVNTANDLEKEIRVTFYQTPVYVDDIDISENIYPPNVSLSKETLQIYQPEQTEINYSAFTPEFPFRQLTGESILDDLFEHGQHVIYIQIPSNVNINTDSLY